MARSKEPKNIEDLIRKITGSATEDDQKNVDLYEQYIKTSNQAKIQNRLISPALEGDPNSDVKGAYHTFASQIDKEYSDGQVDVKDTEKLHRVIASYMLGYFEHAKPSVLKHLPKHLQKPVEQLNKDELEDLYETLAHHFDLEVGAGQIQGVQAMTGLDDIGL